MCLCICVCANVYMYISDLFIWKRNCTCSMYDFSHCVGLQENISLRWQKKHIILQDIFLFFFRKIWHYCLAVYILKCFILNCPLWAKLIWILLFQLNLLYMAGKCSRCSPLWDSFELLWSDLLKPFVSRCSYAFVHINKEQDQCSSVQKCWECRLRTILQLLFQEDYIKFWRP